MPAKRSPKRPERMARDVKMVIVVRGELRLTAGKTAVQIAHAAVGLACSAERKTPALFARWWQAGGKKIAVLSPTLEEMLELERAARALHIPTLWIEDAGLTEVPPGTRTCLGLGPAATEAIDSVTGALELL